MKKALSFREVQLEAYEILRKIAEICDGHGWKYFLIYGSLIGAVRHDGVIPWDDDIDIMMPRPDYNALVKYFMEHTEDVFPLKLFHPLVTKGYPHMISRISDMRYRLVFENEKDYDIGIFVDVYPLDGIGNDMNAANKLIHKTKMAASLCFLTSRKRFAVDNTTSKIKMVLKVPAFLWANFMGNKHYIKKLTKYSKKYTYENSRYVACLVWPAGKKHGRCRDVYEKQVFEVQKHKFENGEFNIPVGYDEFLTKTYGNYMIPPSETQRGTNHTYVAYKR